MKILFVTPEFEEQARGITGIVKAMVKAAKADGHEVGILAGYPNARFEHHELLDTKIEHINLQHYLNTGKKDIFPKNLKSRNTLLRILTKRDYLSFYEYSVNHSLVTDKKNMANYLDYIIKIPFVYQFINRGFDSVAKRTIKNAIKKNGVDLVITGAPMTLTSRDVYPAKLAQFVHDTMPIDMLETPADNNTPLNFAKQFYTTALHSDLLFTNSKDTATKIKEINPEANIQIVYGTASAVPEETPETAILKNLGIEKDNYLMYLSVVEKRKNVKGLIDAYALIHDKINMPLVICGGQGYGYEEIHSHYKSLAKDIRKDIIFTGFVSENDKYMLLKNARTFTFPSFYEGIGLQIIEAMSCGVPVLTSRKGALPEAGGENAYYIDDPYNIREIADAIYKLTTDTKLRDSLRKGVEKHTDKFTVEKFNNRFKEGLSKIA